eukprot:4194367-Prymnesium_polylepis.1
MNERIRRPELLMCASPCGPTAPTWSSLQLPPRQPRPMLAFESVPRMMTSPAWARAIAELSEA